MIKSLVAGVLSVLMVLSSVYVTYPEISTDLDMSKFESVPVFADEFDGDELNKDYWEYSFSSENHTFVRKGSFWDGDTVAVYGGYLHMRTSYYPDGIDGGPAGWYNSAIKSNNRIEYKYGYIETRCIVPSTRGMLGAFWLNSANMSYGRDVCQDGLNGTEIDIFESYMLGNYRPNSVAHNIHTNGYGSELTSMGLGATDVDSSVYDTFHTYGFEWTPEKYIFYVDGIRTAEYENSDEGRFKVSQSWEYLIFSCETSGSNGIPSIADGNIISGANTGSYDVTHGDSDWKKAEADFIIDYVRLYRFKDECGENTELTGSAVATLPTYTENVVLADRYCTSNGNEGVFEYYDDGETVVITKCDAETEGEVTVPSEIDGRPVTEIAASAFANCKKITAVNLPDTVKKIGDCAFYHCVALESINLPDGITRIGDYAFSNCIALDGVILPDSLTDIGKFSFEACFALEEIIIPEGLTEIGESVFSCCNGLKSVIIPSSVTRIGDRAFFRCLELCDIIMPDDISFIGTGAFADCRKLKAVDLSGGSADISSGAFENCESLIEILLPSDLSVIERFTFKNCEKLPSVTIPDSVTAIGEGAFSKCYGLRSVNIPASVTRIEKSAFEFCESLENVSLSDNITEIGAYAFSHCASLDGIVIPSSVTAIGSHAFLSCDEIKTVAIPSGLNSVGAGAFASCGKLEYFTVESGNSAFSTVDGVLFSADGKKLIQYPGGKNTTEYTIPDGVTAIGDNAFTGSAKLYKVIMPDTVKSMGKLAFSSCPLLYTVILSQNLTSISREAFIDCDALSYLRLPEKITYLYAYSFCYIPTLNVMFVDCDKADTFRYSNSFLTTKPDHVFVAASSTQSALNAGTIHYNSTPADYTITETAPTATTAGRIVIHCNICDKDIVSDIAPTEKTSTLYFDANGGLVDTEKTEISAKQTYGALPVPERENYIFTGWFTSRTDGFRITSADIVDTSVTCLYAHGSGKPVQISFENGTEKTVFYGDEYGIMPVSDTPDGVSGVWYDNALSGAPVYRDTVVTNASPHTLYLKNCTGDGTVTFDLNTDKTDVSPAPEDKTVTIGNEYGDLPIPTAPYGYDFGGWFTAPVGGTEITAESTALFSGSITLYAQWNAQQKNAYLDYNYDNIGINLFAPMSGTHSFGDLEYTYDMEADVFTVNGTYTKSTNLIYKPMDIKEGDTYIVTYEYISGGYSGGVLSFEMSPGVSGMRRYYDLHSVSGTKTWVMTASHEQKTKGILLWAWYSGGKPIATMNNFTFRIKLEKVESEESEATAYTAPAVSASYEDTYKYLPVLSRDNYTFLGWFTEKDGGERVDKTTVNTTLDDITLYARWECIHAYKQTVTAATCTENGVITCTCERCGDIYTEDIPANGHDYSVKTADRNEPTCVSAGTTEKYKCTICGQETGGETIAKIPHKLITERTAPTCVSSGTEVILCSVCGEISSATTLSPVGHSDKNADDYCDVCGEKLNGAAVSSDCTCNCHKTGFMGFIWKIQRIFYKLFKIKQTCSCGAIHY